MDLARARTLLILTLPLSLLVGCGDDDRTSDRLIGRDVLPADLRIPRLVAPTSAAPGDTIVVELTVANQGKEPSTLTRVSVFLSEDTDITIGDVLLGEDPVPALGVNGVQNYTLSLPLPLALVPGQTYYVGAIVDAGDVAEEASENNNSAVDLEGLLITGTLDLEGTQVLGPGGASCPGETVSVTATVSNVGTVTAPDFRVGVYLSDDVMITPSDQLLGSYTVSGLAPGAGDHRSVDVTIPPATPPGTQWTGLIADDLQALPEQDETNNVAVDAAGVLLNSEASEPNGTRETAAPLGGPGPAVLSATAYICPEGDQDFLAFEQTVGMGITVDLTGLVVDLDLDLLDVNGSVLASSENAGAAAEQVATIAGYTGTHYVRVRGGAGGGASAGFPYQLTVTLP